MSVEGEKRWRGEATQAEEEEEDKVNSTRMSGQQNTERKIVMENDKGGG